VSEKARILYVDDEKEFAESMAEILRSREFEVKTAYSGNLAFAIYKSGDFDLLITDLNIPGMDGIELIRQVRRLNPAQRIMVVTDFASQWMPWNRRLFEFQDEAIDLDTIECLVKPFSIESFIEATARSLKDAYTINTPPYNHMRYHGLFSETGIG